MVTSRRMRLVTTACVALAALTVTPAQAVEAALTTAGLVAEARSLFLWLQQHRRHVTCAALPVATSVAGI